MRLQLIVKRAPVTSASAWMKQAWQIFRTNPGLFIGINVFLAIVGVVAIVPVVGILILFVLPFLQAGFYSVIVAAQQNKPVEFAMIFKPFQILELRAPMLKMAAAQLLCSLPALYCVEQLMPALQQGQVDLPQLLLAVVLYMINLMLFAYAVPIIYFLRENRLYPVIQASVTACWRNVLPLTLYSVMAMGIVLTGVAVLLVLTSIIPVIGQLLILPMILVMMPIFSIAFFLSFSEFFALVISKEAPPEVFEV